MNVTVEITTLTNGGDGLGRVDGKAVFVSGAVPGDVVSCRIDKDKKRYAKATLLDIITPSPQRIQPGCRHFDRCGGCDWQMLDYVEQCRWKERLLRENCQHQLNREENRVRPLYSSAQTLGYRSRVQFKCCQSGHAFHLGFFQRASHKVVDVDSCPVVDARINELIRTLRQLFAGTKHAANIAQIDVAVGDAGLPRIVVHYTGRALEVFCVWLTEAIASLELACFVQSTDGNLRHIQGDECITIAVDNPPLNLAYAPGGFAQINLRQNRLLVDLVVEAVCSCDTLPCTLEQAHVLDLYCGMGNFSLPLARRVGQVTAVEGNAGSIRDAKRNATLNGVDNVVFYTANVARFLRSQQQDQNAAQIVILDPPRAGVKELVPLLIEQRHRRIVYVSCDQQTMLRDVRELCAVCYRVHSVQPLDMFPQTAHTEVVAILDLVD